LMIAERASEMIREDRRAGHSQDAMASALA
jgi:hypothetical protein